jgi:hypothetical protein
MTHLDISNTSYGQKKGRKSNWQFDFRPLKVKNRLDFFCMQVACHIPLKISQQRIQLFSRPHFNQRSAHKVMGPQSCESPSCGNFETLMTKWHLGAGPMAKHRVYYKGEGGGFPQVWVVVNLVSLCLPMARLCTKVLQLCINQLVVWFVQVRVSNWCLSLFLVPISKL